MWRNTAWHRGTSEVFERSRITITTTVNTTDVTCEHHDAEPVYAFIVFCKRALSSLGMFPI